MKHFIAATALSLMAQGAFAQDNPMTNTGSWADLSGDFLGETVPLNGEALFSIDAPYRAHDAATVPVILSQTAEATPIERAMVIIDENPAPMAAELTFGPDMYPLNMELRIRVNQYSNVRVIADTSDGTYMAGRYVKASGGCSAPASRDPELALASMGQMRLKQFDEPAAMSRQRREAQIMIRHPNYSGLQRDQITQLFIGAHFIDTLEVYQGDDMLFTMEGGISISENPVFRFFYLDNGADSLRVRAHDTEGNVFEEILPKDISS